MLANTSPSLLFGLLGGEVFFLVLVAPDGVVFLGVWPGTVVHVVLGGPVGVWGSLVYL